MLRPVIFYVLGGEVGGAVQMRGHYIIFMQVR